VAWTLTKTWKLLTFWPVDIMIYTIYRCFWHRLSWWKMKKYMMLGKHDEMDPNQAWNPLDNRHIEARWNDWQRRDKIETYGNIWKAQLSGSTY
jgi:hypothetical protein